MTTEEDRRKILEYRKKIIRKLYDEVLEECIKLDRKTREIYSIESEREFLSEIKYSNNLNYIKMHLKWILNRLDDNWRNNKNDN